jgi:hypothetical protein
MTEVEEPQKPIVISEDDARGAQSPNEVPKGDTLVPMLLWTLGLAIVGVIAAMYFMN